MFAKVRRTPSSVIGTAKRSRTAMAAATAGAVLLTVFAPAAANAAPGSTAATKSEIVLAASDATWVTARATAAAPNKYPYLSVTRSSDRTFLKFDTSNIGADKTVVSATLELTVRTAEASKPGVQVFAADHQWSADSLTNANRPAAKSDQVAATSATAVAGKTLTIPITSLGAVYRTKPTAFELGYEQSYVGNTIQKLGNAAPKLRLVLSSGGSAAAPAPIAPAPAPAPVAPAPAPAPVTNGDPSKLSFAVSAPGSSAKKVFAHYFPPYPVSIDNKEGSADYYAKNYLSPSGEGGKFAAYGGLLRDRPLERSPLSGDWRFADLKSEVKQAADAGIDGFTVNLMGTSGRNWTQSVALMEAAEQSGRNFTVVPNVDVTGSIASASPATIAGKLAELYRSPAAYRLSSGEYVLSSFKAENKSVEWWSEIKSRLKNDYNINVAFVAVFLNASDANMKKFAPISYGLGNWGLRSPKSTLNMSNFAAKAHNLGKKWMSPVAVQDERPTANIYAEAGNTETLRNGWKRAIADDADFVQLATWNDYSESTSFAPSEAHGYSFLDINAYYLTQFKSGNAPKITSDSLYVTHRVHPYAARPTQNSQVMRPTLEGTSTPPRDTVEVVSVLTAPSKVTVTIGGKTYSADAPAGVSAVTFPLGAGKITAAAVRGGATVSKVASPFTVVNSPERLDMQYFAASSRGK